LTVLTNVTLQRSNSALPDDGDYTETCWSCFNVNFNTLNAELNPICHLLALLGAHHILHVSRIRVNTPFKKLPIFWCKNFDNKINIYTCSYLSVFFIIYRRDVMQKNI